MNVRNKLRALLFVGGTLVATACADAEASNTEMTVYATPTCGCCGGWVEHMRENGFTVTVVHRDDLSSIRTEHKLPPELTSCHMGVVQGFAVEGHVPAEVVHRLLRERPAILGIAAPGMPLGSPGMEMPDGQVDSYEIFSYDESGTVGVYEYRN